MRELSLHILDIVQNSISAKADTITVEISEDIDADELKITVSDSGCGIEDVEAAKKPLFTTSPETERSGMGFAIMESSCDRLVVRSSPGKGTKVTLFKIIG